MLTEAKIKNAKAKDGKPVKLADYGGLILFVSGTGLKYWRWRYSYGGKEKVLSIGCYPAISLLEARASRDAARVKLDRGVDPSVEKQVRRAAGVAALNNSFQALALAWHAKKLPSWTPQHADNVLDSLASDVFPKIGGLPIAEIDAPAVLSVLREIEKRGAIETAHRVRQRMSAVFVYGIASGVCSTDPAAIVGGAMETVQKGRQPAITDLDAARAMLGKTEIMPASPITRLALRFLALTAVRSGEMRGATWDGEFEGLEGDSPLWRIPAIRMKMRVEHLVPLSPPAVEVLLTLQKITGRGPLCFPTTRNSHTPLSENSVGYLLNRAGYKGQHVPHGWRSTFSTVMNERYRLDQPVIDLMLAHKPKDAVESAYNRALHIDRRRELSNIWAGLIMEGGNPINRLLDTPHYDRRRAI